LSCASVQERRKRGGGRKEKKSTEKKRKGEKEREGRRKASSLLLVTIFPLWRPSAEAKEGKERGRGGGKRDKHSQKKKRTVSEPSICLTPLIRNCGGEEERRGGKERKRGERNQRRIIPNIAPISGDGNREREKKKSFQKKKKKGGRKKSSQQAKAVPSIIHPRLHFRGRKRGEREKKTVPKEEREKE